MCKNSLSNQKAKLRALKKRGVFPFFDYKQQYYDIGKKILPNSGVVAFYAALNNEPNLLLLAEEARNKNLITLYPRIEKDELIFCPILSEDDFQIGSFGILEPITEAFTDSISMIFVPGVFFGKDGSRLGRGKGYYDRFFAKNPNIVKIGAAFHNEIQETLPMEEHDIFMDMVLTERKIILCDSKNNLKDTFE